MDSPQLKTAAGTSDHLANERTFLAWVRTSIALMGFGFVIVKFALFLREIPLLLGEKIVVPAKGYSAIIGVIMVAFGGIMATLAYLRYRSIERHLENNSRFPTGWLSVLVTLFIAAGCIILLIYLLPNIRF